MIQSKEKRKKSPPGKRMNITNQRFGMLTALKDVGYDRGYRLWKCKCDCGKIKIVRSGHLTYGQTRSCGCQIGQSRKLKFGMASFNSLFSVYRSNAIAKNIDFHITKREFKAITSKDCFYCGVAPKQEHNYTGNNGKYLHNGVDRVDNTKGYVINNCVPCCKICNYMKLQMSSLEFYNQIERIFKYMRKSGVAL